MVWEPKNAIKQFPDSLHQKCCYAMKINSVPDNDVNRKAIHQFLLKSSILLLLSLPISIAIQIRTKQMNLMKKFIIIDWFLLV
jgi:hypothetical protein